VKINQVNFSYSSLEDRLLFRLNTLDKVEFRMWLTRAMSFKLLGLLQQAARASLRREQPDMMVSTAPQTVEEFRRDAALARADYEKSFSSEAQTFPLGPQALLVADILMDASKPTAVLVFRMVTGQEVNISLDHDLGVAVGKLLSNVVDGLDWGGAAAKELPIATADAAGEKMMLH
jgi:hypothetical protein